MVACDHLLTVEGYPKVPKCTAIASNSGAGVFTKRHTVMTTAMKTIMHMGAGMGLDIRARNRWFDIGAQNRARNRGLEVGPRNRRLKVVGSK